PVETYWRRYDEVGEVMASIASEVRKGRSAYIVAPLIEESETLDLKNVQEIYHLFLDHFGEEQVELVHGRMKPAEKNEGMGRFEQIGRASCRERGQASEGREAAAATSRTRTTRTTQ